MTRLPSAPLAALVAALCLFPALASAQGTARAFLEARHEEVNGILRDGATTDAARRQRTERLTRMLNDLLDYQALAEAALADHWRSRSETEREQFVNLLRQLVERNYETNLERILEFEVSYDDERARGDRTVVTTSARSRTQRRQPPVEIEYTLRRDGRRWRVVDVTTDGVSMVRNYRDQFGRIIARDGWAELIARMERRLEENRG
ncbi:MAG: ABC transporter substrate-binding protein [Sandaracinaceae bacterium]|nr:ABC transporter substrate-binding protein [Sandaracinaceae bacterium]